MEEAPWGDYYPRRAKEERGIDPRGGWPDCSSASRSSPTASALTTVAPPRATPARRFEEAWDAYCPAPEKFLSYILGLQLSASAPQPAWAAGSQPPPCPPQTSLVADAKMASIRHGERVVALWRQPPPSRGEEFPGGRRPAGDALRRGGGSRPRRIRAPAEVAEDVLRGLGHGTEVGRERARPAVGRCLVSRPRRRPLRGCAGSPS